MKNKELYHTPSGSSVSGTTLELDGSNKLLSKSI